MNLAAQHLLGACRFARRLTEVEQENIGQPLGPFWEEVLHNALAVATMTTASLECYANEFYFENAALTPALHPQAVEAVADLADQASIVNKYDLALAVRSGRRLDQGAAEVQNVAVLIKLRNEVVHFHPEWVGEQVKHARLSAQLARKFDVSPVLAGEPVFPYSWASASFAAWALTTVVRFLDHFCNEAAMQNPMDHLRPFLVERSGGIVRAT